MPDTDRSTPPPRTDNGVLPTTMWGVIADAARRWGIFAALVIVLTGVQVVALKTLYESQQKTESYVRDVLVKELTASTESRARLTVEINEIVSAREGMVKAMDENTKALNKLNQYFERADKPK